MFAEADFSHEERVQIEAQFLQQKGRLGGPPPKRARCNPPIAEVPARARRVEFPAEPSRDASLHLREENAVEWDRGGGRVMHMKLSVYLRPADDSYHGQLYVDRDYKEGRRGGACCRFPLCCRAAADLYVKQCIEIFTEYGKKSAKLTHQVVGQPPRQRLVPQSKLARGSTPALTAQLRNPPLVARAGPLSQHMVQALGQALLADSPSAENPAAGSSLLEKLVAPGDLLSTALQLVQSGDLLADLENLEDLLNADTPDPPSKPEPPPNVNIMNFLSEGVNVANLQHLQQGLQTIPGLHNVQVSIPGIGAPISINVFLKTEAAGGQQVILTTQAPSGGQHVFLKTEPAGGQQVILSSQTQGGPSFSVVQDRGPTYVSN
ncbi:uncharacterized protein LOC119113557 [Pollicipes pollicipes]|uniref:uncharacterized protein LOC119113557 n=1 Tax=Pollicipes pollicipes TaxID=41117 RepID=UPI001884FAE3|nr:uncharacterized protein LOC119113557 [Pollicipes pollicipes]